MRTFLLSTIITLLPFLALAEPQCSLPSVQSPVAGMAPPTIVAESIQNDTHATELGRGSGRTPELGADAAALDHIVAAGARLAEAGTSHGLRTVIARNDGQFMRLYLSPDGQAVVAGLMTELSPAELLAMAPGQVTELGRAVQRCDTASILSSFPMPARPAR